MKKMVFSAEVSRLDDVIDFVNAELEQFDVPMKAMMQIGIAVEEIFVNIAHYAYQPESGDVEITVDVEEDPACAMICFADRGVPYDPLKKEDPDITLGVEEREIGGLGIYMVKKSMDDVTYIREDNRNILTIRKRL